MAGTEVGFESYAYTHTRNNWIGPKRERQTGIQTAEERTDRQTDKESQRDNTKWLFNR